MGYGYHPLFTMGEVALLRGYDMLKIIKLQVGVQNSSLLPMLLHIHQPYNLAEM